MTLSYANGGTMPDTAAPPDFWAQLKKWFFLYKVGAAVVPAVSGIFATLITAGFIWVPASTTDLLAVKNQVEESVKLQMGVMEGKIEKIAGRVEATLDRVDGKIDRLQSNQAQTREQLLMLSGGRRFSVVPASEPTPPAAVVRKPRKIRAAHPPATKRVEQKSHWLIQ